LNGLGDIREADPTRNQVRNPIASTIALRRDVGHYQRPIRPPFRRGLTAPLKKIARRGLRSFVAPLLLIDAYLFWQIFIAPRSADDSIQVALCVSMAVRLWFRVADVLNSVPAQIRKNAATLGHWLYSAQPRLRSRV